MPRIWDYGVYGLVYDGRKVDLTNKVDYITSSTKIVIFRKSGGVLKGIDTLRSHGFSHIEEWSAEEQTPSRLEVLSKEQDTVVFFETVRQMNQWRDELKRLGIRYQLLTLVVVFLEDMLPKYRQVYTWLEDDESRRAYTASLSSRFKLIPDSDFKDVFCADQYFAVPEMQTFSADEVFVDCGAFVGDTVEAYLQHCQGIFHKAIAFEPGPKQHAAMKKRFHRLKEEWALPDDRLVCVQAGLSSVSSHANISGGEMSDNIIGTRLVESTDEDAIRIVTLDEVLSGQRVDFIKADIEGYEMDMLQGAEHLIREQRPRLAICLYHKITDPYEIPLYLKKLVPEYHFKVRHHSMNFTENVLYAYC